MKKRFLKTTALLLTMAVFSVNTVFAAPAPPPRGNHHPAPPVRIEQRHNNYNHRVAHHTNVRPTVNVRVHHDIPPEPPRHHSSSTGFAVVLGALAVGAGIAAIAVH